MKKALLVALALEPARSGKIMPLGPPTEHPLKNGAERLARTA